MAEAPKFELPAVVRARLQAASAASPQFHPEPDMLAAFSERALSEAERERILAHLAGCDRCREVLALIAPEEGPPRVEAATLVERAGFSWRALRWGAVAAALALVAVVTIPRLERAGPSQTAAVRPFSENAPTQQSAKEETETKSPSAANVISDKIEASQAAPGPSQPRAVSRLDQLAKTKSEISPNGSARLDRDSKQATILANGGPAIENNNTAKTKSAAASAEGGFGGGKYKTKQAAAPAPAAPASQPDAAESYAASEAVEVTSAAPNVKTEANTPAAANEFGIKKDQASAAVAQKESPPVPLKSAASSSADMVAPSAVAGRNLRASGLAVVISPQPWRVRSGKLQHLTSTAAWQPVEVEPSAQFTAVFALGQDVWAGAQNLVVYHSSDGGAHWSKATITPYAGAPTNASITSINFSDPQHGQLYIRGRAADGSQAEDLWMSNDGGKTWLYETID